MPEGSTPGCVACSREGNREPPRTRFQVPRILALIPPGLALAQYRAGRNAATMKCSFCGGPGHTGDASTPVASLRGDYIDGVCGYRRAVGLHWHVGCGRYRHRQIVTSGKSKVIQPKEVAVVKAIHVQDGQAVTAGQLLIELESQITTADCCACAVSYLRCTSTVPGHRLCWRRWLKNCLHA